MKADIRWLDDPQVFRVNRLDAHSDHTVSYTHLTLPTTSRV